MRHRATSPRALGRSVAPREASWHENLGVALLGAWTVGGLYLDGWAHENLATLETFFTPWHGALYSGLLALIVWKCGMVARRWRRGGSLRDAVPPGYGIGLAGLAVFAAGGLFDLAWHTVVGIERSIDALLSPPHLTMFFGAFLALTSPLRARWAADDREEHGPTLLGLLPALLVTALATAVVAFFFMYLSVYTNSDISGSRFGRGTSATLGLASQQIGIASALATNLILFAPLLLLVRRWVLPFGAALVLLVLPAVLLAAVREFEHWHAVVTALGGALLVELVRVWLRPTDERRLAFRLFAGIAPLAFWAPYGAISFVVRGIIWSPELVFGVWLWTGLSGFAISVLLLPPIGPRRGQLA
jgi:hypothetical protein